MRQGRHPLLALGPTAMSDDDFTITPDIWDRLTSMLTGLMYKLNEIDERTESIMSTIQDLVTEDAALGDEINQVIAAVQADGALIAQLQAAIGSGNLSPQQQADVDNLFAQVTAQHDQIVAALTPAAPAPAPEPVPAPPADATPPPATPDPVNG